MNYQGFSPLLILGLIGLLVMVFFISRDKLNETYLFPSSYFDSKYFEISTFLLNLTLYFEKEYIHGSITIFITSKIKIISFISLDMNDQFIKFINIGNNTNFSAFSTNPYYEIKETDASKAGLGQQLKIKIPNNVCGSNCKNFNFTITIDYLTNEKRNGYGNNFLKSNQTFLGEYPFYYSYCYPNLCRDIFPIQDSLDLRANFNATINVPDPLKVWMAASDFIGSNKIIINDKNYNSYSFTQNILISSFMFNFAAGVMEEKICSSNNEIILVAEKPIIKELLNENFDLEIKNIEKMYSTLPFKQMFIMIMPKTFHGHWIYCPGLGFISHYLLQRNLNEIVVGLILSDIFSVYLQISNWNLIYLSYGYTSYLSIKLFNESNPNFGKLLLNRTLYDFNTIQDNYCSDPSIDDYLTEIQPNLYGINPSFYSEYSLSIKKGVFFFLHLDYLMKPDDFLKFTQEYIKVYSNSKISHEDFQKSFINFLYNNSNNYTNNGLGIRKQIKWKEWWLEKCKLKWYPKNLTCPEIDESVVFTKNYLDSIIKNKNFDNFGNFKNYHVKIQENIHDLLYGELYKLGKEVKIIEYIQRFERDILLIDKFNCYARWTILDLKILFEFNENTLMENKKKIIDLFSECYYERLISDIFELLMITGPIFAKNLYEEYKSWFHLKNRQQIYKIVYFKN